MSLCWPVIGLQALQAALAGNVYRVDCQMLRIKVGLGATGNFLFAFGICVGGCTGDYFQMHSARHAAFPAHSLSKACPVKDSVNGDRNTPPLSIAAVHAFNSCCAKFMASRASVISTCTNRPIQ